MRTVILVIAAILASCIGTAAQTESQKTDQSSGKEIFAAIADWADAVRNRDAKALDKIFETDVIITSFDGTTRGKIEEMEILKPNGMMKMVSISNDDIKVRMFDKMAVVTALTRMNFVVGDKESSSSFRYTAVFIKKDGRWQIIALQTARAPQQTPAK